MSIAYLCVVALFPTFGSFLHRHDSRHERESDREWFLRPVCTLGQDFGGESKTGDSHVSFAGFRSESANAADNNQQPPLSSESSTLVSQQCFGDTPLTGSVLFSGHSTVLKYARMSRRNR